MKIRSLFPILATLLLAALPVTVRAQAPRFEVSFAPAVNQGPLTGRLVLVLARAAEPEPRLLISPQGPPIAAIDVEQLAPGQAAVIDTSALGYPASLAAVAPGEYWAQAVLNVYTQAKRSDGHTIWVALNDGRQEFFSNAAGNLYSEPVKVTVGSGGTAKLQLTKRVPPVPQPTDTEWLKYVSIRSEKLTKFWGRPITINATVLLPKGYAEHPGAKYPVVFVFGHSTPFGFQPDSTRVRNIGQINPVSNVETGYDFYKAWNSDNFPRFIAVTFQQQTPYFADSYSINSANNGPYGDALVEEVIPALEKQFRMIGKPYARLAEGASTGGWQTLALQLHYPDFFGGAWVLQPDPIDFRRYILSDIYQDTSAFVVPVGQYQKTERPFRRTVEGQMIWSMRELSRFEATIGSRGRSSYQLGAWEAVYGPVGEDGYPKQLWDKLTGKIDRSVAEYMRDNGYDLRAYAEKNWSVLGPKLRGKLYFFSGDMDDFYLNLAVYRFEEFVRRVDPSYPAEFTYGRPMKGHSWHQYTWADLVRRMGEHVKRNAGGESVGGWSY